MDLTNIKGTVKIQPLIVTIYGDNRSGKTTWAAGWPKPIFLDLERKTGTLELVTQEDCGVSVETGHDVLKFLEILKTGQHDFKTLVIDSVTVLNDLLEKQVCDEHLISDPKQKNHYIKPSCLADIPYGKGTAAAVTLWKQVSHSMTDLSRKRGMNVVMIGHGRKDRVPTANGETLERYNLRLPSNNDKGAEYIVKQLSHYTLFLDVELFEPASKEGIRHTQSVKTRRTLYTQGDKLFYAGSASQEVPIAIPLDEKNPAECFLVHARKAAHSSRSDEGRS